MTFFTFHVADFCFNFSYNDFCTCITLFAGFAIWGITCLTFHALKFTDFDLFFNCGNRDLLNFLDDGSSSLKNDGLNAVFTNAISFDTIFANALGLDLSTIATNAIGVRAVFSDACWLGTVFANACGLGFDTVLSDALGFEAIFANTIGVSLGAIFTDAFSAVLANACGLRAVFSNAVSAIFTNAVSAVLANAVSAVFSNAVGTVLAIDTVFSDAIGAVLANASRFNAVLANTIGTVFADAVSTVFTNTVGTVLSDTCRLSTIFSDASRFGKNVHQG